MSHIARKTLAVWPKSHTWWKKKYLYTWEIWEQAYTTAIRDETDKEALGNNIMLMSGKTLLQEVEKGKEFNFAIVGRPKVILTSKNLEDLPE